MSKKTRLERMESFFLSFHRGYSTPSGHCHGCPLRGGDVGPGFGGGDWNSDICIVAITPNEGDKRNKRPEVPDLSTFNSSYEGFKKRRRGMGYWNDMKDGGENWRKLSKILPPLGIQIDDVYYTNSQKCSNYIEDELHQEYREWNAEGARRCETLFHRELKALKPRLIVAMGRQPWEATLRLFSGEEHRYKFPGVLVEMPDGETNVLGLYHWGKWHLNCGRLGYEAKDYEKWATKAIGAAVKTLGLSNSQQNIESAGSRFTGLS